MQKLHHRAKLPRSGTNHHLSESMPARRPSGRGPRLGRCGILKEMDFPSSVEHRPEQTKRTTRDRTSPRAQRLTIISCHYCISLLLPAACPRTSFLGFNHSLYRLTKEHTIWVAAAAATACAAGAAAATVWAASAVSPAAKTAYAACTSAAAATPALLELMLLLCCLRCWH